MNISTMIKPEKRMMSVLLLLVFSMISHGVSAQQRYYSARGDGPDGCVLKIDKVKNGRKNVVGNFMEGDPNNPLRLFIDTNKDWNGQGKPNSKDKQNVKIIVKLTSSEDLSGKFVNWRVEDPDMEADHPDVDENGPAPGDNTGNSHEGAGEWLTQADHQIRSQRSFPHSKQSNRKFLGKAQTEIDNNNRTTVIFNGSDDGGDDFKIIACCPDEDPGSSGSGSGGSSGGSSSGGSSGDSNNGSECDTIDLTMWRKRFVDVYAMEKKNDDSFVAGVSFGDNIGKDKDAIDPGGNGKTDTMILGGDDERDGEKVTSGDNGKVETQPNSGQGSGYYPSNAGNRKDVVDTFRESYANKNKPDHLAYIDFVVKDQNLQLPHIKQMECPDTTPPSTNNDWTKYIDKHVHGNDKSHDDYTYDLIGISDFRDTTGNSTIDPHIGIGVQFLKTLSTSTPNEDALHESGHNILQENIDIHINHSNNQGHCQFTSDPRIARGLFICSNHIKMIRKNVTRSWSNHDTNPTVNPSEDENDSD